MNHKESKKSNLWLDYAKEDLRAARELKKSGAYFSYIIAYHCHQTAEKSLKGFLIAHHKPYPKTHDLIVLLNLCKSIKKKFESILSQIRILNFLYIEEKYPFESMKEYDDGELKSFINSAQKVLNFVQQTKL